MKLFSPLLSFAFLAAFFTPAAFASSAPDFIVRSQATSSGLTQILAQAPAKHHFNTDAPMRLERADHSIGKPTSAGEKEVRFDLRNLSPQENLRITLYLCDDAKTFCEIHAVNYSAGAHSPSASTVSAVPAEPPLTEASPAASQAARSASDHGFIVNQPDEVLAQAKVRKMPILIDFFGIWCPPCNELDEKVFSTREFARASDRFLRLKLDVDNPVSFALKSRYRIGGYPTIIFASSEGDEIARVVGFREKAELIREINAAYAERASPLLTLEKKAQAGDRQAADRAGLIRLERGENADAQKLLEGTKTERENLARARIGALQDENAPAEQLIPALEQAIAGFPRTPNTVTWHEKLAQLYGAQKDEAHQKAALKKAIGLSRELAAQPALLKGYDSTPADVLENLGSLREELDGKAAAKPDWLAAARAYAARGVGPTERGNNVEMAYCLAQGGELKQAEEIYGKLEKAYPSDFTFFYYHAKAELNAGHPDAALPLAQSAYRLSYGDNHLRVAETLAKVEIAQGNPEQARATIDETLKATSLPSDSRLRTHRYARALRDLQAKLAKK